MADEKKKNGKKSAVKAAAKKPDKAKDSPKYGIADLAAHMKLEPATLRVKLRQHKIKKSGKSYGWSNDAELKSVTKQLAA